MAAKRKNAKRAKIDEIIKYMFTVSKETLVGMLNSLFKENFDPDDVEIVQTNPEFDEFDFKIIRGDIFFRVTGKITGKTVHYHIEFQTLRDRLVGICVTNMNVVHMQFTPIDVYLSTTSRRRQRTNGWMAPATMER